MTQDTETKNQCSHEGCTSFDTTACYLPDTDLQTGEPDEYLCWDHIKHSGYCAGCGMFWGGIESFDFGNGFCEHCNSEIEYDTYDDDDEYFEY